MTKKDYNILVKMYDALKVINTTAPKLSSVPRFAIDLACKMATRDALKEHDNDACQDMFLEVLTEALARAQHDCAETIMAHQEKA